MLPRFAILALYSLGASAAPAPLDNGLSSILTKLNGLTTGSLVTLEGIIGLLKQITPAPSPATLEEALGRLQNITKTAPSNSLYAVVAEIVAAGLTSDNVDTALQYIQGFSNGENSLVNVNSREPSPLAYPKASPDDAPYDLSEDTLRKAIYIPPGFQYGAEGAPQPLIMVPGTGLTGYESFKGNLIPLVQQSRIADPVWLNIPDNLLADAQTNAEYVAYCVNYIHGISNRRKVAVLSWSQGGLISQWAYKYWPSTRDRVTDHIAHSADYHGTFVANALALPGEALAPSVLQQQYNSNMIKALRANNGASSYVPTTTIYSGLFDDVVEPQQGTTASAYLENAHGAGVSNIELQSVCPLQPAGGFFLHEGPLYNNLAFELLKDALTHDGPGEPSRLDLSQVCALPLTSGISLADFSETENSILIALLNIVTYPKAVTQEPAVKSEYPVYQSSRAQLMHTPGYAR